jgi:hypothetical protein
MVDYIDIEEELNYVERVKEKMVEKDGGRYDVKIIRRKR